MTDWVSPNDLAAFPGSMQEQITDLQARLKVLEATNVTAGTLAEISTDLGVIVNGGIIATAGTSTDPTDPAFSGSFFLADPVDFGALGLYHWGGVNAGTLEFGINAANGQAYFAGGVGIIGSSGLRLAMGAARNGPADGASIGWTGDGATPVYIESWMQGFPAFIESIYFSKGTVNYQSSMLTIESDNYSGTKSAAISLFAGVNSYISLIADDISFGGGNGHLVPGTTYTPTPVNLGNVTASGAYSCQYAQLGNFVMVSGRLDVTPTVAGLLTEVDINIPITSNLSGGGPLGGSGGDVNAKENVVVYPDGTNHRARLVFVASSILNHAIYFNFSYTVN